MTFKSLKFRSIMCIVLEFLEGTLQHLADIYIFCVFHYCNKLEDFKKPNWIFWILKRLFSLTVSYSLIIPSIISVWFYIFKRWYFLFLLFRLVSTPILFFNSVGALLRFFILLFNPSNEGSSKLISRRNPRRGIGPDSVAPKHFFV